MLKLFDFLISLARRTLTWAYAAGSLSHRSYSRTLKALSLINDMEHIRTMMAQVDIYGLPFYIDTTRSSVSEILGNSGLIKMSEKDSYGLKYVSDESPVIIDIGSHIGIFPRVIANRFEKSIVYSLEPSRENYSILKMNNEVLDQAYSFQLGVYSETGKLNMKTSDENSWRNTLDVSGEFFNSSQVGRDTFSEIEYEVDIVTIDQFLKDNNIDKVSMLGITVPGEIELDVLRGASKTLENLRPIVSVAVYEPNQEQALELMEGFDYRLESRPYGSMMVFMPNS